MGRKKIGAVAKLLQEIKPYYTKTELEKILGCAPATRRKWEGFCLEIIPEFAEHWESKQPLNFHQCMCLAMVAEWKAQSPTMTDKQLIGLIEFNAEIMTIEMVMKTANQVVSVSSQPCTPGLIKVA